MMYNKQNSGQIPVNLRSHIQKQHPEEYAALWKIEESIKKAKMKQDVERHQALLKVSHQLKIGWILKKWNVLW